MIRKVTSLIVAENVVNFVLSDGDLFDAGAQGYVESYQNGREQGLLVWTPNYETEAYYICVERRGDEPTVYTGEYAMQSISEDAYRHSHSFKTPERAARFIVERIAKEAREYQARQ